MCGIAGIIRRSSEESCSHQLDRMMKVQTHRGPDGEGKWARRLGDVEVALGHSRLAILDLSDAGRQPMVSSCGRYVLSYNGEVYNYLELRDELARAGVVFRSQSDTEVVLHALAHWGERAFERFNGMWALAWLDVEAGSLLLSRDRFGIKPLYIYEGRRGLFFASEIKGILAGSGDRFEIDVAVAGRYLQQAVVDAQRQTFFTGIEMLPAGHAVRVELRTFLGSIAASRPYWAVPEEDTFDGSVDQRIATIRETFLDAVRLRLRSDVPVGVLLSGGVDSSSIASAMHVILGKDADLHIMSATSSDPRYDEQPFIDRMAAHLGRPVHKVPLELKPTEAFHLLEKVTWFNDEPLGSFSNVAHFQLMQRAKELGVTVVLSGQGADELLCGYKKYLGLYVQWLLETGRWHEALRLVVGFVKRGTVIRQFRVHEAKRYLPDMLRPKEIDIRGPLLRHEDVRLDMGLDNESVVARQRRDLYQLSVPAIVHWEDRMSMACSREIRLPFLDYRVVSLLLPLSLEWKLRDGWTKWAFRKAMENDLPPEVAWRKDKQGFVNPQSEWLKHELQEQVEALFKGDLLIAEHGLVDQTNLVRRYEAYCRQSSDWGSISFKDIFNVVALEIWARQFDGSLQLGSARSAIV